MIEFFTQHSFLFAQVFGFAAMTVTVLLYQSNKHKTIMSLMVLCASLWVCHYIFLGKYTAVAANLINVARNLVFSFREKKWAQSKLIPAVFIAAFIISGFLTWENIWSLFPLVASVISTIANWSINTKRLRILTLPVSLSWLTYNSVNKSWAGMANEIFCTCSILIAIVRYDLLKKPEKKSS